MIDFKSFRQSLTAEQVEVVVCSLGSLPPKRDGFALCFQTICHNDPSPENSFKLYYYPSSCLFNCFTECGETYDVVDLVVKVRYTQNGEIISKFEALEYVENLLGVEAPVEETEKRETTSEILAYLARIESELTLEEKPLPEISEVSLSRFPRTLPLDWIEEGISKESLIKYEIGYDPISVCITIPVRDKDGKLIGIRGRRLEEPAWDRYGRYGPLISNDRSYSFPTSFNLYGLYYNSDAIRSLKKAIIVEGEKSVMLGDTFFGENNIMVATQGSNLSLRQAMMLKRMGVKEITFAFDRQFKEVGDQEYSSFIKKMNSFGQKLSSHFDKIYYICDEEKRTGYKDAPCDRGADIFKELYTKRKELK